MEDTTIDAPVGTESAKIPDNQIQEVVTESAKPSDNQEGQVTETVETEQVVSTEPKPYSFEELQNVKSYTELDPGRLPKSLADAINAGKVAQGELTKVQQRLAAQEKTTPKSQRPTDPYDGFAYDVFEAFDQDDYIGVNKKMSDLAELIENQVLEYTELQYIDPEKAAKLKQSILANRQFKVRLNNALSQAYQNKSLDSTLNSEIDVEVFKAMPNFNEVAPEIASFAMKDLHFDQATLEGTMDARVYIPGLMQKYNISRQEATKMAKQYVIQLTKGMHDIYMRISGKGIRDKENRTPNKTEGGGSPSKTTDTSLDALRKIAMKTGDNEDLARYYDKKDEQEKLTRRK